MKFGMITHIKKFLSDIKFWCKFPSYRLLRHSILFDSDYYLKTNPDVAASGEIPLAHYITSGFTELRRPSPLFDSTYYVKQLPFLAEELLDPLNHYLVEGWKTNIKPNFFFDPEYYKGQNKNVDFSQINPFIHFLKAKKSRQTSSPSPYFDPDFYCDNNPKAEANRKYPVECYKHYLTFGFSENFRPSIYFDTAWYLDKVPIFNNQGLAPIIHYFFFGMQEKKSPSPLFDPTFYEKAYDVKEEVDLFGHYLRYGMVLDHKPCQWFDPLFYRQTYLTEKEDDQAPLKHFLQKGLKEGLYPNREVHQLAVKPVISILVPVYNAKTAQLNNCIRSVLHQSYPHWELCLADDCSTDEEVRPLLEKWAAEDSRIKTVFLEENSGISAATNSAATLASGSYLGFLDNDDELVPEALFTYVQAINRDDGDLFYSDEDLIGDDGRQYSIFRKPAFNSELLLCHNYVTHCVLTKRSLFEAVGGCDSTMDGAQDLDLFLKLSEQARKIVHIPQILYHWRASESSTSINHEQKGYANEAGRKSVANALARRNIVAETQLTDLKFYYRSKRTIADTVTVAVIVYWDQLSHDIVAWLKSLVTEAGYDIHQIIVVAEDHDLCDAARGFGTSQGIDITCSVIAGVKGPASANNIGLSSVEADFVALVSSDLEFNENGWLSGLLEYGQQTNVGMVAGRLYCTAEDIDTVTPIPDYTISSTLYYANYLTSCSVLMNGLHCPQEVQSVNMELCLVKTELLKEIGGFNSDDFPSLFAIHDLCYRLGEDGKKNIYSPYSSAVWKADARRFRPKGDDLVLQEEKESFIKKWHDTLFLGDLFFNTGTLSDCNKSPEEHRAWLIGKSPTEL